jgi:hypothetical protein
MFDWMASGACPKYFQMHLWMRDQERKGPEIRQRMDGATRILELPHADVVFDSGKAIFDDALAARREKDGFRLMRVGPYHHPDNQLRQYGPYFMTSAHYLQANGPTFAHEGGVLACLDSGGAQIKFGKTSYVPKERVLEIYNKYADVGLALDIPPRTHLSPRRDVDHSLLLLDRLSTIQKQNNDYFAANRRADLRLLNVAHGLTGDDFRRWIEKVDDPKAFTGWAISFDSDLDPYCIWRGAAVLLREHQAVESWLHLFAVSGASTIPVMAWLGRGVPQLTSDSSTWVQHTQRRNYLYNDLGRLLPVAIGTRFMGKDDDLLESYCSCAFCQVMRTFGAHRQTHPSSRNKKDPNAETHFTYPALAAHNLIAVKEVVRHWNEMATQLDFKAYRDEIRRCFPKPKRGSDTGNRVLNCLDYLVCAVADGPEYADRHVAALPGKRSFLSLAS